MPITKKLNRTCVNLIEIDSDAEDRRLDNFLIGILHGVPRSHIYNLIRKGQVRINSGRVKANQRLRLGDQVRVPPVSIQIGQFSGKIDSELKNAMQCILYEDDSMLVLDKPAGVTVHSGTRHNLGLIEALKLERKTEPGIELVHRLDKDTSGVLILAKGKRALRTLQAQWRREVDAPSLKKIYCALLKGRWNGQLERCVRSAQPVSRKLGVEDKKSMVALSYFSPIHSYRDCTLVNIELYTGKTHQARLHARQIGQPIAGDGKFGDREFNRRMHSLGLKRMFLHARRISLLHPLHHNPVTFESQLPAELTSVTGRLNE